MSNWPIIFLIFLTGCLSIIQDPSYNGDISPAPYVLFQPEIREGPCLEHPNLDDTKTYSLAELIDIGLENNPSTKTAWFDAKSQAFSYYSNQANYFPTIDFQEDAILQNSTVILKKVDDNDFSGGIGSFGLTKALSSTLSMQYLLFDFGTRSGLVESAKQALIAANWQHHYLLQQVIYDVARSYYDYLEAEAFIQSSQKNLDNAKTALDAATAQFEAGVKTRIDLLQATSNFYNAELDLQNRQAEEKVAMAQLAESIGVSPNNYFKVKKVPYEIQSKPIQEGIEELMEYARKERADLAAQEAFVFQKLADWQIAKGNALPTLSTNISLNRTQYYKGPALRSKDYIAVLELDIPLFTGFFDYNQIRKARADYAAAYSDWEARENAILVDVIASYYQYVTANENLKTTSEYVKFAEEAFESVLVGYREGIQTIVDLLSAQNTLADARAKVNQSRAAWLRAIVNIAFTTGLLGVKAKELSIVDPKMVEGISP